MNSIINDKSLVCRFLMMAVLFLSATILTGCFDQCQQGVYTSPPSFSVTRFNANKLAARIGDTITINWAYNSGARVAKQSVQILKLTPSGVTGNPIDLRIDQRSYTFSFDGPVSIVVNALESGTNKSTNAAIDIKQDSIYAFRMKGLKQSHNGYPRIGLPSNSNGPIDIEFSQFFGIYDGRSQGLEDGVIDSLQTPEILSLMPSTESFFGHSWSVDERDWFKFKMGSAFPMLDPGFLNTAAGSQFYGRKFRSNMVVFAGRIAYNGTVASDPKTGQPYRKNVTGNFEPMFAAIDVRTDDSFNPYISDITIGNTPQGLTVSVFHGIGDNRTLGTSAARLSIPAWGQTGVISGSTKGSRLGFGVTTSNGTILTTYFGTVEIPGIFVEVANIEWNMPLYHDSAISQ